MAHSGYRPLWTGTGIIAGWLACIPGLSFYARRWIGVKTWRWLHRWTLAVGDIQLGGTDAGRRIVRIEHPLDDNTAHEIELASGAIATSGLRTRIWQTADGYSHHLIDPARGDPAWTGVIQATALAPTALEAETLAKTALLQGPEAGRELLARHGGALILDERQATPRRPARPAEIRRTRLTA